MLTKKLSQNPDKLENALANCYLLLLQAAKKQQEGEKPTIIKPGASRDDKNKDFQ